MDDDVKLNYGVFETQDVEWLTPNEILNLLEALKMVPRTKIRSMLLGDHIHMQSERNYDEAWRMITSKPPVEASEFIHRHGLVNALDMIYLPNEMLIELCDHYKRVSNSKIKKALLL